MKVYSIKKGTSMTRTELNPYAVGLMRLSEMAIAQENFSDDDITHIGFCSIHRIEVVLCKVGNFWGIRGRLDVQLIQFEITHGYRGRVKAYYRIYGKKVMTLRSHNIGFDTHTKTVSEMSAMEIFMAAKGKRPGRRHAPKMTSSERIASAARMEKL